MKKILFAAFIVILTATVTSCADDAAVNLVLPENKNLSLSCGGEFKIPLLTQNWIIESVKEMPSGNALVDKNDNPISLDGNETIEAYNGWFTISSKDKSSFTINLKENFDRSNPRNLAICINQDGERDYVHITQIAGETYELVESTFEEIKSEREIFKSTNGCCKTIFENNTSINQWFPSNNIFSSAVRSSDFQSDDYGAFKWMYENETEIIMPDLVVENLHPTWNKQCTYKEGITTEPYIKDILNGNKTLVPPYTKMYFTGEITYCKRVVNYTLTILNTSSKTKSNITGVWTQIIPISTTEIASDKPF